MTCDYCGGVGHNWETHPEAVADVRSRKAEEAIARESDEWMSDDA